MASGEESSEDSENLEELYKRLQVVMDSLPPKCKEIFILGCVEGLSYKDVAEQLGVSVNTVKTQVKVAYKKIKSEFGDHNKNFMLILCNSFFQKRGGEIGCNFSPMETVITLAWGADQEKDKSLIFLRGGYVIVFSGFTPL